MQAIVCRKALCISYGWKCGDNLCHHIFLNAWTQWHTQHHRYRLSALFVVHIYLPLILILADICRLQHVPLPKTSIRYRIEDKRFPASFQLCEFIPIVKMRLLTHWWSSGLLQQHDILAPGSPCGVSTCPHRPLDQNEDCGMDFTSTLYVAWLMCSKQYLVMHRARSLYW